MIHLDAQDTIVAIASPPGPGIRGLVRVSGPRTFEILGRIFHADHPETLPRGPSCDPGHLDVAGQHRRLTASVTRWPGPRTYTGQDLAEIHIVGSPPILQLVLETCLAGGARLAEPGEFTLRAFLSGRLDLTRVEAVLGVIDARTSEQLATALQQLAGGLAHSITRLRDRLLDILAHLEAGLDFVDEEDVDPISRTLLADELARAAGDLTSLAETFRSRDRPGTGLPRVVLVGPPNAGKSRLFNALVGDARAIVSHVAGTTRDYLAAPCTFDGVAAELVDTAGVDDADHPIEAQAQVLRAAQVAGADVLLACRPATASEYPLVLPHQPHLQIATKCDLAPAPPGMIATSAETGEGLERLRRAVADALRAAASEGDSLAGSAARCRDSLSRASQVIEAAGVALASGAGDELVAVDLRAALEELGKVVGAVVTDDILDRIFSRFCIGK